MSYAFNKRFEKTGFWGGMPITAIAAFFLSLLKGLAGAVFIWNYNLYITGSIFFALCLFFLTLGIIIVVYAEDYQSILETIAYWREKNAQTRESWSNE